MVQNMIRGGCFLKFLSIHIDRHDKFLADSHGSSAPLVFKFLFRFLALLWTAQTSRSLDTYSTTSWYVILLVPTYYPNVFHVGDFVGIPRENGFDPPLKIQALTLLMLCVRKTVSWYVIEIKC